MSPKLFGDIKKHHDAQCSDGRLVQIKTTMKGSLTFPADHIPNYYLGVQLGPDGQLTEIFNGPGAIAWKAVKDRSTPKTNLHSVSIASLRKLQAEVSESDRIPPRRADVPPTA